MSTPDQIFLAAASFISYTYAAYPLGIWALSRTKPNECAPPLRDDACPEVTVVISAHNEAARVRRRIENLRSLDYPQDKLHLLFVSDGSSDRTAESLRQFPGVQVIEHAERGGKAHALNSAMAQVKTPVVLFCDMRQTAERHSLRLLVSSLMQPGVGAVSGELTHVDPGTQVAANIGLYWRYEKWIRKSESRWRSVVGATGAFYAIKTPCFVPLAPGTLLDDFEIPMQIARQGQRVLLDGRSLVFDELQNDMSGERKRKLRTLGGNFQSFARHPLVVLAAQQPHLVAVPVAQGLPLGGALCDGLRPDQQLAVQHRLGAMPGRSAGGLLHGGLDGHAVADLAQEQVDCVRHRLRRTQLDGHAGRPAICLGSARPAVGKDLNAAQIILQLGG